MKCSKCKAPAWPFGLACPRCSGPLAEADAGTRRLSSKGFSVCLKCGERTDQPIPICIRCRSPFATPFSCIYPIDKPWPPPGKDFWYYEIVCCPDACTECKRYSGLAVRPRDLPFLPLPVPSCQNTICSCGLLTIYRVGMYVIEAGVKKWLDTLPPVPRPFWSRPS